MKTELIGAVIKNGSYRSNRSEYVLRGNKIFKRTIDGDDWKVAQVLNGRYCFICDDVRPYTVEEKKTEVTVRGTTFSYTEQIAHCAQCGKEVYDPDVNDANCRAREKAYAECKDMNDILNQVGDGN